MSAYISQAFVLALVASSAVQAHTVFSNIIVDGQDQANNNCIRMSTTPNELNFPILNLGSNDMVCNVGGQNGVEGLCSVKDGAKVTVQWREVPNQPGSRAINPSHSGACAVYMKKVNSALEDNGQGNGWFKIFEDGYDAGSGQWCTDKLNANDGKLGVQVPSGLVGGDYLFRPEVIALHRAHAGAKEPEYYTGCAQINIESNGNKSPSETVSIPGFVDGSEPGLNFNLYDGSDAAQYVVPGPKVLQDFSGSSGGSSSGGSGNGDSNSADSGNNSDVVVSGSSLGTSDTTSSNTKEAAAAPEDSSDNKGENKDGSQDSCNATTMVTVTVTATVSGSGETGGPDAKQDEKRNFNRSGGRRSDRNFDSYEYNF